MDIIFVGEFLAYLSNSFPVNGEDAIPQQQHQHQHQQQHQSHSSPSNFQPISSSFSRITAVLVGGTAKYLFEVRMNTLFYLVYFLLFRLDPMEEVEITRNQEIKLTEFLYDAVNLLCWYKTTYNVIISAESIPSPTTTQREIVRGGREGEIGVGIEIGGREISDQNMDTEESYLSTTSLNDSTVGDINILSSFIAYTSKYATTTSYLTFPLYTTALLLIKKIVPAINSLDPTTKMEPPPLPLIPYLKETGQYRSLGLYALQLHRTTTNSYMQSLERFAYTTQDDTCTSPSSNENKEAINYKDRYLKLAGILGECFVSEGRRLSLEASPIEEEEEEYYKEAKDFFKAACSEWFAIKGWLNMDCINRVDINCLLRLINIIEASKDLEQCDTALVAKLFFLLLEMVELNTSEPEDSKEMAARKGYFSEKNEEDVKFLRTLWTNIFRLSLETGMYETAYWCLNEERRRHNLLKTAFGPGLDPNQDGDNFPSTSANNLCFMVLSMCEHGRLRDVCSNVSWNGRPRWINTSNGLNSAINSNSPIFQDSGPMKVDVYEPSMKKKEKEEEDEEKTVFLINDYQKIEDLLQKYSRITSMELLEYDNEVEMRKASIEENNLQVKKGRAGSYQTTRRTFGSNKTDFASQITFDSRNPLRKEPIKEGGYGIKLIDRQEEDSSEMKKKILHVHWYQCAYSLLVSHQQYQKAATELYALHKKMESAYQYDQSPGHYNLFHVGRHVDILSIAYDTLLYNATVADSNNLNSNINSNLTSEEEEEEQYILFPYLGMSPPRDVRDRRAGVEGDEEDGLMSVGEKKTLVILAKDIRRELVYYMATLTYAKLLQSNPPMLKNSSLFSDSKSIGNLNKNKARKSEKERIETKLRDYQKLPRLGYIDHIIGNSENNMYYEPQPLMDNDLNINNNVTNSSKNFYFDSGILSSEVREKVHKAIDLLILAGLYRTASILAKVFTLPLNYIVKELAKTCVILQQGGDISYVIEDNPEKSRILAQAAVNFTEDELTKNKYEEMNIFHENVVPRSHDAWALLRELVYECRDPNFFLGKKTDEYDKLEEQKPLQQKPRCEWTSFESNRNLNYLFLDALDYIIATESYFQLPNWLIDNVIKKQSIVDARTPLDIEVPLAKILMIFLKKVTILQQKLNADRSYPREGYGYGYRRDHGYEQGESADGEINNTMLTLEITYLLDSALDIIDQAISKNWEDLEIASAPEHKDEIKKLKLRLPMKEISTVLEYSINIMETLERLERHQLPTSRNPRVIRLSRFKPKVHKIKTKLKSYFHTVSILYEVAN